MKPATDDELFNVWDRFASFVVGRRAIYDLGVEHGRQQAAEERPLWPEPITDRLPTDADGDKNGRVQIFFADEGVWGANDWRAVANRKDPWQHTHGWQPKPPTLKEKALAILEAEHGINAEELDIIRRALEAQP